MQLSRLVLILTIFTKQFSLRTRGLDYLWAVLPLLIIKSDNLADLTEEKRDGLTVMLKI
jgi:hypothetical protein